MCLTGWIPEAETFSKSESLSLTDVAPWRLLCSLLLVTFRLHGLLVVVLLQMLDEEILSVLVEPYPQTGADLVFRLLGGTRPNPAAACNLGDSACVGLVPIDADEFSWLEVLSVSVPVPGIAPDKLTERKGRFSGGSVACFGR
jgi:hypothetical protein